MSPPTACLPERELVARATAGDDGAFGELHRRHAPAVERFLARRVTADLVEDLTAETFVAAWRFLPRFTWQRETIRPWLLTIARRQVLARCRRRSSTEVVRADPRSPAAAVDGFDDAVVEHLVRAEVLRTGLAALSPDHARVLQLRFLAELSVAETATLLHVDVAVVRSRCHRALRSLRHALADPV